MFKPTNNRPIVVKIAVVTTFVAALAVSPLAVAQEQHGADTAASKEVTGEVVDMMCYVDHNAVGEKHGQACGAKSKDPADPLDRVATGFLDFAQNDREIICSMAAAMAAACRFAERFRLANLGHSRRTPFESRLTRAQQSAIRRETKSGSQ